MPMPKDLTWREFPPHATWADVRDFRAGRITWDELVNRHTDEGA